MLFAFNTLILCKDTGRVSGGRREEGGMERCNAGIEASKVTLHTWRKSKKGCRHVSTAELWENCKNTVITTLTKYTTRYLVLHQQNKLWDIFTKIHYEISWSYTTKIQISWSYINKTHYEISWSYTMHCIDSAYSNTCESSKTSGCRRWRRKREFWNTCLWLRFLNSEVLRCALPLSNQPSSGSCLYGYMCTCIYVCMQTRVQK